MKLNFMKMLSLNKISNLFWPITCKYHILINTVGILDAGNFSTVLHKGNSSVSNSEPMLVLLQMCSEYCQTTDLG